MHIDMRQLYNIVITVRWNQCLFDHSYVLTDKLGIAFGFKFQLHRVPNAFVDSICY